MTTDTNNTAQTDDCNRPAGAGPVQRSVSGLVNVAVLFARQDSTYKTLPQCDVYDIERDARTYDGPLPVVAHPPCRAWGRLRTFANPRPDERNLARLAVALVREFGGVLEHPASSTLWDSQRLPAIGGAVDEFGGWTTGIHQWDFGHRAQKPTWLYIVGCRPSELPELPELKLGEASHVIAQDRRRPDGTRAVHGRRPEVTKPEREHTPPELARWLVELAGRCKPANARLTGPKRPLQEYANGTD